MLAYNSRGVRVAKVMTSKESSPRLVIPAECSSPDSEGTRHPEMSSGNDISQNSKWQESILGQCWHAGLDMVVVRPTKANRIRSLYGALNHGIRYIT